MVLPRMNQRYVGKKAPDYQGTVYLEAAPCFFAVLEGSGKQSRQIEVVLWNLSIAIA